MRTPCTVVSELFAAKPAANRPPMQILRNSCVIVSSPSQSNRLFQRVCFLHSERGRTPQGLLDKERRVLRGLGLIGPLLDGPAHVDGPDHGAAIATDC